MQPVGLGCSGIELADGLLIRSAVNYAGRIAEASSLGDRGGGYSRLRDRRVPEAEGRDPLPGGRREEVALEREFLLASGLPYLYATTRIVYPETRSENFDKQRATRAGAGIRRQLARGHALRDQARSVRRSEATAQGLEAQPSRPRQPLRSRLRSVLPESGDRFVQQSRHPRLGRGDGRGEGDAGGTDGRGQRLACLLPDANTGDPGGGRASS